MLCLFQLGKADGTDERFMTRTDSTDILFPKLSSVIDPLIYNNSACLSKIISKLDSIETDASVKLVSVTFEGSASPEGGEETNRRLAGERLSALEKYVREHVAIPDSVIRRQQLPENWDLLIRLVSQSDNMPGRDKVLKLLNNTPEYTFDNKGRLIDSRRKRLMEIDGGRAWNYLDIHCFESMRKASAIITTEVMKPTADTAPAGPVTDIIQPSTETQQPETVSQPEHDTWQPASVQAESKPFYMSLKTNGLYDLLTIPNIGIEFYLGKNWSITANWMYSWWNSNRRHRYWRFYGGDIAVRRWFGSAAQQKPLTGHHIGVYGQLLTYDVEFGGKGQMAGEPGKPLWSRPSYAAGVEYGYSLPIARRLNLDFTIGVGYLGGRYYEYTPRDGHYVWKATKQRHWFGPTKVEVSLVWLLGHGNFNDKKRAEK